MISINPYLNFMGNTEDAMTFYKSVFGVEFTAFSRFNESPGFEKMALKEQSMIMHASLPMGHNAIMATDALESMGMEITMGNNFYINIATESVEETDKFFNGLAEGGKIEMPLNQTFWGAYCGMCRDKFGIQWMVNFDMNFKG